MDGTRVAGVSVRQLTRRCSAPYSIRYNSRPTPAYVLGCATPLGRSHASVAMLAALSQLRPGERRSTRTAFAFLTGLIASHTLLETARDALFLTRLPSTRLP